MFAKYFAVLLAVALLLPACTPAQVTELKAVEAVVVSDLHTAGVAFLGALTAAKENPATIQTAISIGNALLAKLGVAAPQWLKDAMSCLTAGNVEMAIALVTPAVAALVPPPQPAPPAGN